MLTAEAISALLRAEEGETLEFQELFGADVIEAAVTFASIGQSMDAPIEPRKTRADLDLDAVRRYMRNATQQGRRHFAEHDDPWQVLQKLELVQSDTTITRAAIPLPNLAVLDEEIAQRQQVVARYAALLPHPPYLEQPHCPRAKPCKPTCTNLLPWRATNRAGMRHEPASPCPPPH
ncbi:hypothetical protein [Acidovorax sp. 210-6]|uniref:hypothetical protein n=1 Tax=Acidovorax sp. 210-6 TaxID=2699468 RepID=UPI0018D6DB10|nr:hypothetical protein [Acidovorax sp. 210-6]